MKNENIDLELNDGDFALFRLNLIDWDTDGEQIDGLPDTLDVWACDDDHAIDIASDEIVWCIQTCYIEKVADDH